MEPFFKYDRGLPALHVVPLQCMFSLTPRTRRKRMAMLHNFYRRKVFAFAVTVFMSALGACAQTDCADGDGVLENNPPKNMTAQELIKKFTAEETKVKEARAHYTFTQD